MRIDLIRLTARTALEAEGSARYRVILSLTKDGHASQSKPDLFISLLLPACLLVD